MGPCTFWRRTTPSLPWTPPPVARYGHTPSPATSIITNRGINYWERHDRTDRRLLFCADHSLRAMDAVTGKPILSFGAHGAVDLKEGLDRDPRTITLVQSTTPGRVFEDKLILGSATNQGYGSAPGDIRAFDVRWKSRLDLPHGPAPR